MGIQGLIPFVEKASTEIHIRNIAGASVAIDSYCWLHKGIFGCADKLIRGEPTDLYVKYCLKYVEMLLSYRMNIVMVFDGCHLPAKSETEKKRSVIRKEARLMAQQCLRNNDVQRARSYMRRAVDITHEMALQLIRECRKRGIDCIVAPYEADAQMAWLNKVNLVEYVITEDSDLLLFGAQKILFKLDLEGCALLVDSAKLPLTMGCKPQKYCFEKFRRMCILSGCDYLDSLPGVGLKKACKFMLTTEEDDMTRALKKLPQYLNMRHLNVTDEYIENFLKAEATFRHMYIYNPLKRKMERLNDLNVFNTNEKYCTNAGELFPDEEQAFQLALGNLNPFNLKEIDNWHPDNIATAGAASKRIKSQNIWRDCKLIKADNYEQVNSKGLDCKKIVYSNMNDIENQETKLDEEEINALYSYAAEEKANNKRKRDFDMEETENLIEIEKQSSSTTENPARFTHNISDNVACNKASVLKSSSPNKLNCDSTLKSSVQAKRFTPARSKIEIKSRFFIENHKLLSNASSKRRDLILEVIDIEEESKTILNRQQPLYAIGPSSPELQLTKKEEEGHLLDNNCTVYPNEDNNESENLSCERSQSLTMTKSLLTTLEGNYTQNANDETTTTPSSTELKLPLIKVNATNKTRRLGLHLPKKKVVDNKLEKSNPIQLTESKQLTLSKFNFQKRTILKKN